MNPHSPDAEAVVRATDAMTAQLRRIADALTTPTAEKTPATARKRVILLSTPCAACTHPYNWHVGGVCQFDDTITRCACIAFSVAADEDEQLLRWARRESLLVLVTRVQHGRTLTEDESRTLREHVETEMREAETARTVAAGNLRHVKALVPELEQALAAIEHVRALVRGPANPTSAGISDRDIGRHELAVDVLTALDGAGQSRAQKGGTL